MSPSALSLQTALSGRADEDIGPPTHLPKEVLPPVKYTLFGESHGPAIGAVLEGVPPGLALSLDAIRFDLSRRAPGKNALSTARREADEPQILSGVFEGKTTGAPLCAVIKNTDTRSGDYAKTRDLARPGHADYPAHVRYAGCNDYRGGGDAGGHFRGEKRAGFRGRGH